MVMLFVSLWTEMEGAAMAAMALGLLAPSISLSGEGNQRLGRRSVNMMKS